MIVSIGTLFMANTGHLLPDLAAVLLGALQHAPRLTQFTVTETDILYPAILLVSITTRESLASSNATVVGEPP